MSMFRWAGARIGLGLAVLVSGAAPIYAAGTPQDVLSIWYRLSLELVRHTPTYSPPVASNCFCGSKNDLSLLSSICLYSFAA